MPSYTTKAIQLGYELGQQAWIVSRDHNYREPRNEFTQKALDKKGLHISTATLSAFKAGWLVGWKQSERKAADDDYPNRYLKSEISANESA